MKLIINVRTSLIRIVNLELNCIESAFVYHESQSKGRAD